LEHHRRGNDESARLMRPHVVYLHGFASGPNSAKGAALAAHLESDAARFVMPDLEGGDFSNLTMTLIFERALAAVAALPSDGAPVIMVGSSMGGYVAAQIAATRRAARVRALLLIAPAFNFMEGWAKQFGAEGIARWKRDGALPFMHHGLGREVPLTYAFHASCEGLPAMPEKSGVATTIVHGRGDEVVAWRHSLDYSLKDPRVELHAIEGDHRLGEPRHSDFIAWCARDLITRLCTSGGA
jgi:uncharacterized protein